MLLWYVTQMDLVEDEYSVIEEMQDTINLVNTTGINSTFKEYIDYVIKYYTIGF